MRRTTSFGRVGAACVAVGDGRRVGDVVCGMPCGTSSVIAESNVTPATRIAVWAMHLDFMRAPNGQWNAKFITGLVTALFRRGLEGAASNGRIPPDHAHPGKSAVDVGVGDRPHVA